METSVLVQKDKLSSLCDVNDMSARIYKGEKKIMREHESIKEDISTNVYTSFDNFALFILIQNNMELNLIVLVFSVSFTKLINARGINVNTTDNQFGISFLISEYC